MDWVTSSAALAALGGLVSVLFSFAQQIIENKKKKDETLEQRIEKLTEALKASSKLVAEVESEIKSRQHLVGELQKDAEKYQQLITLNQDQVDAVTQVLQGELRKEGGKSFWKGVAVNFVFFLLGAGMSWYLAVSI